MTAIIILSLTLIAGAVCYASYASHHVHLFDVSVPIGMR